MNILKIESHPYELKFKKTFTTAKSKYKYRYGAVIKIFSDNITGLGEVAPLEDFHKESLQECYYSLEAVNQAINNIGDISSDELLNIFTLHSSGKPSLLFGLQTALFDILSQNKNLPLNQYLNPNALNTILLNGIHPIHNKDNQFRIMKIKLGYGNIYNDIEQMEQIASLYGPEIKFRIDVNGQLDLVKAIRFCKSMEKFNIDYIEQPLPYDSLEDLSELRLHTNIPIAVDESLFDIESAKKIIDIQAADIFIIKPMIIGDYTAVNRIINLANKNEVKCIITNMLDTAINRMACIHLASANNIEEPCGLSGDNLFESDLYSTPDIVNSKLTIPKINGLGLIND